MFKINPYEPFRITSQYGYRTGSNLPNGATLKHDGLDLGRDLSKYKSSTTDSPCGDVFVVEDGTVIQSTFIKGRGYTVVVEHGIINGKMLATLYQHLHMSGLPKVGTKVRCGDSIGKMGRSGMGSDMAVHLHFEVRENGIPVDPNPYLPKSKAKKEVKYVVKKETMTVNGKDVKVDTIFQDNLNYVALSDLRKLGLDVEFDEKTKKISINIPIKGK